MTYDSGAKIGGKGKFDLLQEGGYLRGKRGRELQTIKG